MINKASPRLTRPPGAGLDPQLQAIYENLEILNGARGKGLDRAVLLRDLLEIGIISAKKGSDGTLVPTKPVTPDKPVGEFIAEPPTIPIGVKATGGFATILIEWDKPEYAGHAYTEVFRSDTDVFTDAVVIATTTANLYSDEVGASKVHFYWIRFVNENDIRGPIQSTEGIRGATEDSIGDLLEKLKGNIDESFLTPEFNSHLNDFGENISRNEKGIITLEGEVEDVKTNSEILSLQGEILAEGVAEAAAGVDSEGEVRRSINAQILKTQGLLITNTGAMAQEISEVSVTVDENKASILETKTSIITLDQKTGQAISSVTERIEQQESSLGEINAKVLTNTTTIAKVESKTDANGVEIGRVETSISERLDQLTSQVGENKAGVINNQQTIVAVQSDTDTNKQSIEVLAQQMTTVQSNLDDTTSKVIQNTQTIAKIDQDGTEQYKAQWGVKASIGDIVAGIGITVKKETGKPDVSQCTIIADQFSVGSIVSGETIYPFIVGTNPETGTPGVFIDTAYIKAARIQDLVAGEVVADNVKVGATLTAPYIKGGKIEIGSKFTVDENGNMVSNNAKMTNATVSGIVNANGGVFNNVTINENCDVKGTIYANKIVGDVVSGKLKSASAISTKSYSFITVFSASFKSSELKIPRSVFLTGFSVGCSATSTGGAGGIQMEARIRVNGTEVIRKTINAGLTRSQDTGDEGGTVIGYFDGSGSISGGMYVGFASGTIDVQIRAVKTGWFDGETTAKSPAQNVMVQLVPIGTELN